MPLTLLQAIQCILNAHPEGLTEREIRRALIEEHGFRCIPQEVQGTLQAHPDLFVPMADGRWRARAALEAEAVAAGTEEPRRERREAHPPLLAHLPPLDAFIAFDLETTGLNPHRDRILQIAAVRIVDGHPAPATTEDGTLFPPVFNEYVNLEGREIPYGLRVKLGLTDHPEWEAQLAHADRLPQVLERFRRWLGDLPLAAHNARFDLNFLRQAGREIGWEVATPVADTMELACLARAGMGSFNLEELARSLEVGEGLESGRQVEDWARQYGLGDFYWTGFHNAVVDALVLAATVPRLLEAVRERMIRNPLLAEECVRLMPHLVERLGIQAPAPAAERETVLAQLVGVVPAYEKALLDVPFPFTPETVRAHFEGMVKRNNLRRREAQLQMVEAVSRALLEDRFVLIEAPTGTGKTFAYLVPALLWARGQGEPVVVSTYTRLLQDQMAGDLERVRRYLGVDFRHQVLKGMSNYICLQRAGTVYAQTDVEALDEEERFAWLTLLTWLSATQEGLLDELNHWALSTFPALAWLCESLQTEPEECIHQHCPVWEACFHRRAYERALQADVVVANHALLLSKEWGTTGLPFTRVVVDEAHNLEDAATDAAAEEVSWGSIAYLANRLLDPRSGRGVLIRIRDKVQDAKGQRWVARAIQTRNLLESLARDFGDQLRRYAELNRARMDPRFEMVDARAREIVPGPVGTAIAPVLQACGANPVIRSDLPVVEAALAVGLDPLALDEALYRLALEGLLIYRGFARAFVLRPGPNLLREVPLNLDLGEARRVREEMTANLAATRRYAESLRVGDCLRAEILRYLGAEKPPTRPDQCCILCDVNLPVPWAGEPAWEDLTDPGRYQDARYTVLQAMAWNARLAGVKGQAPYSARTLAHILVGNDYVLTQYEKDPERRKTRRRLIVSGEYFGALEGLKGGAERVLELLGQLQAEGYVEGVERRWDGGAYTYPVPAPRGLRRLEEGRLFEESGS